MPHPMERSVNVRVQTTGEVTATAAMRDALLDIISVCDHVHDTFDLAIEEHGEKNATAMETDVAGKGGARRRSEERRPGMWGRATKLEGGIRRNLSRRRRGSHSARRGRDSARMFERVTSVAQKPRATPSNALEPVQFEPRRAPLRRTFPSLQSKACLFRRIDPPYVRGARDAVGDAAHSPRHQINVPIHRSIDPSIHRPIDSSTHLHRSIARVSHITITA